MKLHGSYYDDAQLSEMQEGISVRRKLWITTRSDAGRLARRRREWKDERVVAAAVPVVATSGSVRRTVG